MLSCNLSVSEELVKLSSVLRSKKLVCCLHARSRDAPLKEKCERKVGAGVRQWSRRQTGREVPTAGVAGTLDGMEVFYSFTEMGGERMGMGAMVRRLLRTPHCPYAQGCMLQVGTIPPLNNETKVGNPRS